MYDKFARVLRIESTCNDISTLRVEREVQHRDGISDVRKAPLKKNIYNLYHLFTILKSANYRYLEFISAFDDHSNGRKKLDDLITALGKEIIAAGSTVKNLILFSLLYLRFNFAMAKILAFCVENHS